MVKSSFSFVLGATAPGLTLTVSIDGQPVWTGPARPDTDKVIIEFNDDDAEHEMCLEMSGKTPDHTTVDDNGQIVEDLLLTIRDMCFDEINVDQTLYEKSLYLHDYNGTSEPTQTQFYGDMGCNGSIKFCFTTPIYLWLLENM
jgi:hypothetical protein